MAILPLPHGELILLKVTCNQSVYTDPNATVAWSENLTPNIKTNLTFGPFTRRGESFLLEFFGEGWILVQPYEEVKYAANLNLVESSSPQRRDLYR